MPWWATILLGIAGMWIGAARRLGALRQDSSFFISLLTVVLLLIAYRKLVQKRPLTGPARGRAALALGRAAACPGEEPLAVSAQSPSRQMYVETCTVLSAAS